MHEHRLKTWIDYFVAIMDRKKTFELRENDRDFKVDDILILQEFDPCLPCGASGKSLALGMPTHVEPFTCPVCKGAKGDYTGREMKFHIRYVLTNMPGLVQGYAVLGIAEAKLPEFQVSNFGKNAREMMVSGLRAMAGAIESGAKHIDGGGTLHSPKARQLQLNMNLTVELPEVDQAPRIQLIN